jgi:L-2-hydroxyglutarate oxidase LhgO
VLLHEFCAERAIPVRNCGKVVVATDATQLEALDALHARAQLNDVPTELVSEDELRLLEPLARTVDRALWSPTTSVASPAGVVTALADRVRERGGEVRLGSAATGGGPGLLALGRDRLQAKHVINAAGLQADRVARWFDMCDDYVMLPFVGLYWYANWAPGRLQRHVYPVPDSRNPFLGVHATVTVDGRVKIGPTAIPALWRESYGGGHGFSPQDTADILRAYPDFLRSKDHDVVGLFASEFPKLSRRVMVARARALIPTIDQKDFREKGRPGVRAQLFHVPTRRLEMDFVVRGDKESTHILNAVSPGWTSSLAVAEYVVADMKSRRVL